MARILITGSSEGLDFLNREQEVASADMTMPEMAAVFSRVLGKNVAYQQISFEAFEQQAGAEVTKMFRWFENVGYAANLAQLKREFPVPTDFESYLRDHGAGQNQPKARPMLSQTCELLTRHCTS